MEVVPIGCSCCNKRLFDVGKDEHRVAVIRIKCPRCRNVIQIKMEKADIKTEQIVAQ